LRSQGEPAGGINGAAPDEAQPVAEEDPKQELAHLAWTWEAPGWYRIEPPAYAGEPWGASWIRIGMSGLRGARVTGATAAELRDALQHDFPFRMAGLAISELEHMRDGRRPTNPAASGQGSGPAKGSIAPMGPYSAYGATGGSGFPPGPGRAAGPVAPLGIAGPGPSGPVRDYSSNGLSDGCSA